MDTGTSYSDEHVPPAVGRSEAWAGWQQGALALLEDYKMKRGLVFGAILVVALASFELFNFSTTEFALTDFLGPEKFLGLRWATILSLAFCGIDFAGLARLFTPERGDGEPVEVWYLLGAWFLGATLNAMATWWAVTLALLGHDIGNEVLSRAEVLAYVPLFVAALVWLTRILIIGTFSVAGERLFSQAEQVVREAQQARGLAARPAAAPMPGRVIGSARIIGHGQPSPGPAAQPAGAARPAAPAPRPAAPNGPTGSFTRPAPKPAPARRPLAGFEADDPPHDERSLADEGAAFSRRPAAGVARPANGVNGPKTIE